MRRRRLTTMTMGSGSVNVDDSNRSVDDGDDKDLDSEMGIEAILKTRSAVAFIRFQYYTTKQIKLVGA